MNAVQSCSRCGARWPVYGRPAMWCPRCNGALLAPVPVGGPIAPPVAQPRPPARTVVPPKSRRNYRWVARRPDALQRVPRPPKAAVGPTPRYLQTPRWGLLDPPPAQESAPARGLAAWANRAPTWVSIAGLVFALAAVAELVRYLVLLHNRTRLINPWILALSDTAVWALGLLAPLAALIAAIAAACWLVRARGSFYAGENRRDPRSPLMLLLGCLIPVVNLVMPGVFLTEFNRSAFAPEARPERRRLIRGWWCAWVLCGLVAVCQVLFRYADSLQIKADGVLFAVFANIVAAVVAGLTLMLIRDIDGDDLQGRPRVPKRWLPATGPAVDVIERIRPASVPDEPEKAAAQ